MDEIDKKIIAQLQADGRMTLQGTIQIHRVHKYGNQEKTRTTNKKGTIKVSALINPSVLKLPPGNRNA